MTNPEDRETGDGSEPPEESSQTPTRKHSPGHRPLGVTIGPEMKRFIEHSKGLAALTDSMSHVRMLKDMMPAVLAGQRMAALIAEHSELAKFIKSPMISGLFLSEAKLQLTYRQSSMIAAPMLSAFRLQNSLLSNQAFLQMSSAFKASASLSFLSPLTGITGAAESLYRRAEADAGLFERIRLAPRFPARYVYTATRATAAAIEQVESSASALEESTDADTETELDEWAAELPSRLTSVNSHLAAPLLGMRATLVTLNPDWGRGFSASGRQLLESLLDSLAPADALARHFDEPVKAMSAAEKKMHFDKGEWTRRAQLRFILRELLDGDFKKMAENMIDICLSLFYPTNAGVHTLHPTLSDLQARALMHQFEASIQIILLAARR